MEPTQPDPRGSNGNVPRALTRRRFISLSALGISGTALTALVACQAAPAASPQAAAGEPSKSGASGAPPPPATSSPSSPKSASSSGQVEKFVVGQDTDIQRLDATTSIRSQDRTIYGHILDPLLLRTASGIQGRIATKWEWASEGRLLRMGLRDDLRFSNGERLTAEDVKYSLDRLRDPKTSDASSNFRSITSVDIVDPTTIELKLDAPDASLLGKMVDAVFVVPAKAHANLEAWSKDPVGSGPYRLVEWIKGDHITLEARADYAGPTPSVKQVTIRVIPEPTTRVAALVNGEMDLVFNLPSTQIDLLKNSGKAELRSTPSPEITYVGSAMDHPILQDQRVRLAVAHAINVQPIAERLLGGYVTPVGTVLIPGMLGYEPPLPGIPYDPARAKQLLNEAGYPNGFEVPFDTQIGRIASGKEVAEAVAADLARVGIQAKIGLYEEAIFTAKKYRRDGQKLEGLYLWVVRSASGDPDGFFGTSILTKGAWNYGVFSDPEFDRQIQKGIQTLDEQERVKIYRDLAEKLRDSGHWVSLYAKQQLYGVGTGRGWSWTPRTEDVFWAHRDVKAG